MKIHRYGPLAISVTLAFALVAIMTPAVTAEDEFSTPVRYVAPAVFARMVSTAGCGLTFVSDGDVSLFGEEPRLRHTSLARAYAAANAADKQNAFAVQAMGSMEDPQCTITSEARSLVPFIVRDPLGQWDPAALAKVTLRFKARASSSPLAHENGAGWSVSLFPPYPEPWTIWIGAPPHYWLTASFPRPVPGFPPDYMASGGTGNFREFDPSNPDGKIVFTSDKFISEGQDVIVAEHGADAAVALEDSRDFSVAVGLGYIMDVRASAYGGGAAAVDPVIEVHPDNPDLVIEFPNTVVDPDPQPVMANVTADDLLAIGIDPQPFIEFGVAGSSSLPGDTTPPTTVASATPGANASGWNKSPVTVTLVATDDASGSGVKEVHYSLAGASTGSQVVPGDSASVAISAEGTTTLTYFAVDNANNQEAPKTLTVRIDRTPPVLAGLPVVGCTLWPPDHRLVQIASVTASESQSGLAGAPVVTATSNEPETGTGAGDLAPDVVITGGTVQVRAERAGNATGRIYTITATASDLAGNTATTTATCQVPHDRRRTAQP